jgi:hypothetical protein
MLNPSCSTTFGLDPVPSCIGDQSDQIKTFGAHRFFLGLFFIKPVYFEELLHHYLISFAEFILENFELTSIDRQDGVFHVHIDEKNAGGNDPERRNMLSKGFIPTITVLDFPISGYKVFLQISRRR